MSEKSSVIKSCFIVLLVIFGSYQPLLATHEADHRYVLSGYVRDTSGVPITDATVLLEHRGGEKKSINTNEEGYYEILFHLHNSSLGDQILVKYGEKEIKHKVDFDPEDKFTNRGAELNFGAPGKKNERLWIYWTGGSLLILVPLFYRVLLRKKKIVGKAGAGKKRKKKK